MWQLIVLTVLMSTSDGLAAPQKEVYDGDKGRPISFVPVPPDSTEPKVNKCGQRNVHGAGAGIERIVDDKYNEARFGEFPWMVAVLRINRENPQKALGLCGGSLIHPRAVLTAASCINGLNLDQLIIRGGEWNFWITNEKYPHQNRAASKIIIHKEFNSSLNQNNFAIIILSTPMEISPHIGVVCLPQENDQFDGSQCFGSGWGKNVSDGPYQPILKSVELPVVPRDKCQNDLLNSADSVVHLHSSNLCAGGKGGVDMCEGDNGGPLVCRLKNDRSKRYVQAGIVSSQLPCGRIGIPAVYSNVTAARKWIDEQMKENDLDTSSYTY